MGNRTNSILNLLEKFESPNVTFIDPDANWPIVWERANGVFVWDAEGKKYLDLTAAFGVAACGHANPRVVAALRKQAGKLLHAMGDVHPHSLKAQLCRELSRITFERWRAGTGKTILGNSGFEAVEAALKTAILFTGKRDIIVFKGGYHGLGYGALNATHRMDFKQPFLPQLANFGHFADFPTDEKQLPLLQKQLTAAFKKRDAGAILVEPIQARGGINVPPPGFLPMLRQICDSHGVLLILDEIYTGFGRTGKMFACEHSKVVPDLICLGKALTGGFPLSACVGRASVVNKAWPRSSGEAIHTSTFMGHPVGCAMALAQIEEVRRTLPAATRLQKIIKETAVPSKIGNFQVSVRGLGSIYGIELTRDGLPATDSALHLVKRLLQRRLIVLPEGPHSNVLGLTPPLTVSAVQLKKALSIIADELNSLA